MNLNQEVNSAINDINRSIANGHKVISKLKESLKLTGKFLKVCEKHGVRHVAIMARSKKIKESMDFPFGVSHSVFCNGEKDGWPVAWAIAAKAGVNGDCGNQNQYWLNEEGRKMLDGVYEIRKGTWMKLKTKPHILTE